MDAADAMAREEEVQQAALEGVRREEERVQQVTMLAWPDMRLQAHSLALHDCVRLQATASFGQSHSVLTLALI